MQLLTYPRQTDCIGGFPSAESLRTSFAAQGAATSSPKDYVQPTKFVLLPAPGAVFLKRRHQAQAPMVSCHKAILLGTTLYELSCFKALLRLGRPRLLPDFYSQLTGCKTISIFSYLVSKVNTSSAIHPDSKYIVLKSTYMMERDFWRLKLRWQC